MNPACVDTLHMYPGACTDRVCAWYVTLTGIDVVHDEADVTGLARRRERAKDCGSVLFFCVSGRIGSIRIAQRWRPDLG